MTEDQERRIDSLFHEALTRPQDERRAYLQACPDAPEVLQRVFVLLSNHDRANEFFEGIKIPLLKYEEKASAPVFAEGDPLGSYVVDRLLGRGGMGEVYLARDQRLGRKVAIKVLSPAIADTPEVIERLRREAMAASALNHPNILTVHEFGESDGRRYIVTEHVEGTSLRELIGKLSPEQAIDYARQIGKALAAAHKVGIIHRDIKPENVMVRPDGYVKVVDFGLAKAAILAEAETASIQQRPVQGTPTAPGILVGTVSYMSPEQLRGEPLDQRTDIWSWGVVLYEMLTGRRPFEGETMSDVIAAILERQPSFTSFANLGLRPKLQEAIRKALEKDVKQRWQHASDLQAELARIEGALARRRRKTLSVAVLVLVVLVVCMGGYFVYKYLISSKPPDFTDITPTPITNSGEVDDYVAISPDGKLAVFGLLQHPYRMVVKQLATGSEITVLEGSDSYYDDAVFSPNGEYIYYRHISGSASDLYSVPALGGPISHIAANVTSAVAFSPDGSRIAFRRPGKNGFEDIVISNADGTNPQVVFTSREGMLVRGAPSWSRELDLLSFSIDDQKRMGIAVVTPSGKLVKTFWYNVYIPNVQWVPKAGGMLFLALDPLRTGRREFWFQPYPDGQHVRVTHDLNQYVGLSVTADGTSFLTSDSGQHSEIYVADVPSSIEHKINWNMKPFSRQDSRAQTFSWISWLADGRLLVEDSTWQLFTLQPDGSRRRVLPQAQNLGWLTSCGPGGTIIAIKYEEDLKPTIWEVNVDSGELKQVTHYARDGFDVAPSCGINGKSIVYILGTKDGLFKTMRVSSEGGDPVQLISGGSWFSPPVVSPNGKLFAQILPVKPFVVTTANATVRLNLYSVDDGKLKQSFGWQAQNPAHRQMFFPRWTADGRLTFKGCTDLICQIYLQPLSEKPAVQLTNIGPSQHVGDFAWSPDGKKLAITLKRRNNTDAVLFTGIKPGR